MSNSRNEREELNKLSQEVFGSSSRWKKLVDTGLREQVMEEVEEFIPPETEDGEGTTRKVKIPVKHKGINKFETRHFDVESIKTFMLERKKYIEEFKAMVEKIKAEEKAKKEQEELAKKVQEETSGSAV